MREWSDTAEEMEVTFRADTSGPWEIIKSRELMSRFMDKLNKVGNIRYNKGPFSSSTFWLPLQVRMPECRSD